MSPAVAPPAGQQHRKNGHAEPDNVCAECGEPSPPGPRGPPKRFCSPACRSRYQGAKFRARKRAVRDIAGKGTKARRAISDTRAVLTPGEIQRPPKTPYGDEPGWVTAEPKPEPLACESREPVAPPVREPFWRLGDGDAELSK